MTEKRNSQQIGKGNAERNIEKKTSNNNKNGEDTIQSEKMRFKNADDIYK